MGSSKETHISHTSSPAQSLGEIEPSRSAGSKRHVTKVTQARAKAQRAKLDRQEQARQQHQASHGEQTDEQEVLPQEPLTRPRGKITVPTNCATSGLISSEQG